MKIEKKHLGLPAALGKGKAGVYRVPKFLRSKIGLLDVSFEGSMPSKKDWQKMLKGLKPGDKVKILYAIIK